LVCTHKKVRLVEVVEGRKSGDVILLWFPEGDCTFYKLVVVCPSPGRLSPVAKEFTGGAKKKRKKKEDNFFFIYLLFLFIFFFLFFKPPSAQLNRNSLEFDGTLETRLQPTKKIGQYGHSLHAGLTPTPS